MFDFRKQTDSLKGKEVPVYKKPNLNHTEYAYREAVNRLKCMLSDTYSPSKQSTFRRHGYESDDTDNVSVRPKIPACEAELLLMRDFFFKL